MRAEPTALSVQVADAGQRFLGEGPSGTLCHTRRPPSNSRLPWCHCGVMMSRPPLLNIHHLSRAACPLPPSFHSGTDLETCRLRGWTSRLRTNSYSVFVA